MIVPLSDYAAQFDSHGAAIEDARRKGFQICKHADFTEGLRVDLTAEEAADVAHEDVGLLFVVVPLTRHTPGPWRVEFAYTGCADVGGNVFSTALLAGPGLDEAQANATRIVQCVNALEGIEDPAAALAEVRAALTDARDRLAGMTGVPDPLPRVRAALALLTLKASR